ncbi:protocadherin beta-15 isoform X2 [Octopus bimaculoides]|uniref:protocadherin beta-15 isoform X2 n=1 Tax=Octopus bimaculoides TaxID=37653 RepID=UPI0022E54BBB|nr:protocadherin beta-15 isoform X2 [Octopus bimaculoides]
MLAPILLILSITSYTFCIDLIYHVEEEQNSGTYVGNIVADSKIFDSLPSTDHSLIWFSLIKQRLTDDTQLFNVSKTGKLYTTQLLDAESLCSYGKQCFKVVKVAVRQAKMFMKILKLKIVIEDINDHSPEFSDKQINLQFSEGDWKGMKKSIPNAIDNDITVRNSEITYELQENQNKPFALSVSKSLDGNSELGIYLKEKLDREKQEMYVIKIIAKDEGTPSKQGILLVHISVTDVNDNAPVFSQVVYNISIQNNESLRSPIAVLSASDLDSNENGKVSYYFSSKTSESANRHFMLNEETGEIFLKETFASLEKQVNELFVRASDRGKPPLSSAALVLINVINQQNNYPTINVNFLTPLSESSAAISEDTEVGSFIAYVMLIDNDAGSNGEVSCELQHNKFQLLMLGSKEYKIILKNSVDRETKDHYTITIVCQDEGTPPLEIVQKYSIEVMDVNDVQPKFTKNIFKFLIYENEKPYFPVGFINATDSDLGLGGQLTFSLLANNKYRLPFQITSYGFVSTNQSVDHELQNVYNFQVKVKDNGIPNLESIGEVIVEVIDQNDNAPYFTFPSVNPFNLDVHYHPQSKSDITTLRASDRDSHVNAFLKYEILGGNEKQLFAVNPYTGVLSFSRTVYQNDAGSYDIKVAVKDSGTPVLSATTRLSLTLTVSNTTSVLFTGSHSKSGSMLDINIVIIIVVIAVVVSISIVVFITICIVRHNNQRNLTNSPSLNASIQPWREMRHLISQTNNLVIITKNPDDIKHKNMQLVDLESQLVPEAEFNKQWKSSNLSRNLPSASQMNVQKAAGNSASSDIDRDILASDYKFDCGPVVMESVHGWNGLDTGQYEEISARCPS